MIYRTVLSGELTSGSRIRRLGKLLTVRGVTPAEHGAFDITFTDGSTTRLAGFVSMVDEERMLEVFARYQN
jgi:hypothetical protein